MARTELVAEQPAPIPNDSTPVWDLVKADMEARDRVGRDRYGTPLQLGNGRDHLLDLYQELLDAVVYVRAQIELRNRALPEQPASIRRAIEQAHNYLHGDDYGDAKMCSEAPCIWLVEAAPS